MVNFLITEQDKKDSKKFHEKLKSENFGKRRRHALVIMGVGSNRPNSIIRDLESKGYTVTVKRYYAWDLPDPKDVDLVIGHSAGGTRAQLKYHNAGVPVHSLNAPTAFKGSNVNIVTNAVDPISIFSGNTPTYTDFSLNPHNKNRAYEEIKDGL